MFSFTKAGAVVLAVASLASATITISTPTIKTNSDNTISWTSSDPDSDPESFSIELINKIFNDQFALANNVQTTQGSITFQLPTIPPNGDGYTIEFVDIGNINNVFATSGTFSIQDNNVGTSAANTSPSSTATGTSTGTAATTATTSTRASTSTSASTLTQSSGASSTAPASSVATSLSAASSTSPSGTSSSSSAPAATTSTGAASGLVPAGSVAALIAGVVALLF